MTAFTKDGEWIHRHFEEIVDQYAGRYVAVANEELFVGFNEGSSRQSFKKVSSY
ncbi:MAG: hypothetical protein HY707_00520 [Ignavibacteriae bacterium]|nr:hypothetical protein [Ignavibacteriota bacterium]